MKEKLTGYLERFVTERRLRQIEHVLNNRTRYITVVLEDIYQPHNASAVLRSCECFGIQDVHIIENRNLYEVNPDVALGAYKWLNLYKYTAPRDNTVSTLQHLKSKGYTLVATSLDENACTLNEFDIASNKIALLFGTELQGLTRDAMDMADVKLRIPIHGFTQSFNISVAAAIILYELVNRLRKSDVNWQLDREEWNRLKLNWLKNSIKRADSIEKYFLSGQDFDPDT